MTIFPSAVTAFVCVFGLSKPVYVFTASVEYAASSRLRGFDGVIQIFPAGCMPEIVGRAVLNRVAEEENVRIMTLIYDEMSGEAGYLTRLEAFTDMLERRKSSLSHL